MYRIVCIVPHQMTTASISDNKNYTVLEKYLREYLNLDEKTAKHRLIHHAALIGDHHITNLYDFESGLPRFQ